ncbi:hypothetical protein N8524_07215 [Candidatus Puniceispirillum sp.]|nr:hypothetical protein [Alphaproteobacteria bacterium]MDC1408100.1 hypothetical protein [Candidatus Puniceispirillum sp.]
MDKEAEKLVCEARSEEAQKADEKQITATNNSRPFSHSFENGYLPKTLATGRVPFQLMWQ